MYFAFLFMLIKSIVHTGNFHFCVFDEQYICASETDKWEEWRSLQLFLLIAYIILN